MTNSIKVKL